MITASATILGKYLMDNPSEKNMATVERWSKIAALVATLATILGAINALQVSRFDAQLKQAQAERELNFKIYASIADALESGDPKRVLAVRGIVDAMASDNIKPKFLEALEPAIVGVYEEEQISAMARSSARSAIEPRPTVDAKSLGGEGEAPPDPGAVNEAPVAPSWGDWDFDIFWCANSGVEAENLANKIRSWLINDGAKGRVRSRVLPNSVNAKSGFRVTGYQIRRSQQEVAMANRIERFILSIEGLEDLTLVQHVSSQNTPWYLSVFVCP